MNRINVSRLIIGGLAAGLMANVFDFVITTFLMESEFAAMIERLGIGTLSSSWMAVFTVANFAWGLILVFAYCAIRPRFGPGPKTAIISAVMLWLVVLITTLILLAGGLHTPLSYAKSASLYLVAAVTSSLVGAALYKE